MRPAAYGLIARHERQVPDAGEQDRHFAQAADVLGPVALAVAEVGVETLAQVVAVEQDTLRRSRSAEQIVERLRRRSTCRRRRAR